jgi:hypothetical protein
VTPAARKAMRLAARTEGIFLDPTYTARALAGLIARVAGGGIKREERTVFMHTGGLPGLFGHPELPCLTVSAARRFPRQERPARLQARAENILLIGLLACQLAGDGSRRTVGCGLPVWLAAAIRGQQTRADLAASAGWW